MKSKRWICLLPAASFSKKVFAFTTNRCPANIISLFYFEYKQPKTMTCLLSDKGPIRSVIHGLVYALFFSLLYIDDASENKHSESW